jgi:hypothetical protein
LSRASWEFRKVFACRGQSGFPESLSLEPCEHSEGTASGVRGPLGEGLGRSSDALECRHLEWSTNEPPSLDAAFTSASEC